MTNSKFLVYSTHANHAQIRIISGVALALILLCVATFFYADLPLPKIDIFIPVTSAILVTGDLITATLLFAEARVLRSRPLNVLGAGYLFTGLMLISRALTFPGAFAPNGLLGANDDTAIWNSVASLAGLPLAIMVYTRLSRIADQAPPSRQEFRFCVFVPVVAAILFTLLTTASEPLLPPLTASFVDYVPNFYLLTSALLLLLGIAMVLLWAGQRSMLDLWLLVVLLGWFLELLLVVFSSSRFTVGWYMGQLMGLLSGLFVLFTLIAETNTLYGQTVQELADQDHEREKRFLTRDAIAASIAHELRQPLAAILLNAQAARKYPESQNGDLAASLDDIINCGHRANDIIQSTRAMFGGQTSEKRPVDLEALVRSTLDMVSGKARARKISVTLVVKAKLKPVVINAVQIQQALLNLFQNAIEALGRVKGRPRTLEVRCFASQEEEEVIIRVEDNGPGIEQGDRERVFTPFFTTRKNGTGLGLMIARLVLEAHGGHISVEPLSPFGTVFVIRLHASPLTQASPEADAARPGHSNGLSLGF